MPRILEVGAWSLLSPAIVGLAALGFVALERVRPQDPGQHLFRRGWFDDLVLYTFAQSYVAGLAIGWFVERIDRVAGASGRGLLRGASSLTLLVLFVVGHDFVAYWIHRAQHRFPLLWRFHEAHHSSTDVDWLAGSRSHFVEILVNQTIEFAPMVLLGATPDLLLMKGAVDAVWGMFIHANVRISLGPLGLVINGPGLHRAHHERAFEGHGANFGTKLACWDRLFGTLRGPSEKPSGHGLEEAFPEGYWAQTLHAFRARRG